MPTITGAHWPGKMRGSCGCGDNPASAHAYCVPVPLLARLASMPFLDLLPAQRIRTGVVVADKADLLDLLAGLLADPDADRPRIHESLLAREQLGSTGLGRGVAIPHGRIATLEHARAAFVRLAEPLAFEAADGEPVDLVAALVVPLHYTDQHLHLLAELAGMFSDDALTRGLRAASGADALRSELAEFKRRHDQAHAWTD